jgi:hypothetical protein
MNIWWPIQFFYCTVASFEGIAESMTIWSLLQPGDFVIELRNN